MIQDFIRSQQCDFPGCDEGLDQEDGALCALVVKGEVQAFCAPHASRVRGGGVTLTTLRAANEATGVVYPDDAKTLSEKEIARGQRFIMDLKRGQQK